MSTVTHKRSVLILYRRILRLHRKKLPFHLRQLGDTYVKKEFQDHKTSKEEFVGPFMREWTKYADNLEARSSSKFGEDLDKRKLETMSDEQRSNLERLRREASGRT